MYDHSSFEDNETSLGYAINVYQESINKKFKEFLVNFNYLTILLEIMVLLKSLMMKLKS